MAIKVFVRVPWIQTFCCVLASMKMENYLIGVIPTARRRASVFSAIGTIWDNVKPTVEVAILNKLKFLKDELLLNPGPFSTPYSSLRPLIAQLIFVHMFLGVAEGAFETANRRYKARKQLVTNHWLKMRVNNPFIQKHFAEFYVQLESVRLLADKAVQRCNGLGDW